MRAAGGRGPHIEGHGAGAALLVALVLAVAIACTAPSGDPGAPSPDGLVRADALAALDPSSVPGLESSTESSTDPDHTVAISTVVAPGLDDLNALTTAFVERWRPLGAAGTDLDVGWNVALAVRSVLALRVHAALEVGSADAVRGAATFYADATRGAAWSGRELFTDDGASSLAEALAAAELRAATRAPGAPAPSITPTSSPYPDDLPGTGVLDDVAFDARGDLLVTRPDADGWLTWKVPADVASPWLSDAGRIVRGSVRSGGTFVGLPGQAAAPAPSDGPLAVPLVPPPRPPDPPAGPDCAVVRCLALTFDDGPGPHTQRLLDELAAAGVPATFFLVGQNAASRPELVAAIAAAGHQIGNHTWNHPDLTGLDAASVRDQLDRTASAIRDASGVTAPLVRPPYGAIDDDVRAVLAQRGSPAVLWSVDTEDWRHRDAAETTRRAVEQAEPGAVVLLHDIHPSTVEAVPGIVQQLTDAGYTFVTVSQLFAGQTLEAGHGYSQRAAG
ncbi:polysaccharide deacetylase [Beutenbergia cavernae DSM 12333]|uniref:Polysaccharide deacetylase n=1 Tax=Beutenbergia cavernae (strain ATCC BAA-8 / DSM 12333 / CCUG 43141 / JCM 11478 / NBRC 16432 / NCIMB 13614 / HKI 0122) TaxID=471853 RepID=C5BV04_BEUC1|nr:polysaccharide deacetylase family protein [Beutenbergia cavernae]ACQ78378.1 polysaccharide deacetylase [Beutenbergia cavernae DSM 12333]